MKRNIDKLHHLHPHHLAAWPFVILPIFLFDYQGYCEGCIVPHWLYPWELKGSVSMLNYLKLPVLNCNYTVVAKNDRAEELLLFFTDLDLPPGSKIKVVDGLSVDAGEEKVFPHQPALIGLSWKANLYRSKRKKVTIVVQSANYNSSSVQYVGFKAVFWASTADPRLLPFPKYPTTDACQSLPHEPIHGGFLRQNITHNGHYYSNLNCIWVFKPPVDLYPGSVTYVILNYHMHGNNARLIIRDGISSEAQVKLDIGLKPLRRLSSPDIWNNRTLYNGVNGLYIELRVISKQDVFEGYEQYVEIVYGIYSEDLTGDHFDTGCWLGENYPGWKCEQDLWCIPLSAVSDGVFHCKDYSDEQSILTAMKSYVEEVDVSSYVVEEWKRTMRFVGPLAAAAILSCVCVCCHAKKRQCARLLHFQTTTSATNGAPSGTQQGEPLLPTHTINEAGVPSGTSHRGTFLSLPHGGHDSERHRPRHSRHRGTQDITGAVSSRVNSLPSLQTEDTLLVPSPRQRSNSSTDLPPSYTDVMSSSRFLAVNRAQEEPEPPAYETVRHVPPGTRCIQSTSLHALPEIEVVTSFDRLVIPDSAGLVEQRVNSAPSLVASPQYQQNNLVQPPSYRESISSRRETHL